MAAGRPSPKGPPLPDLYAEQISLLPPVIRDAVPAGARFGGVIFDVPPGTAVAPGAVVNATFHSASPRNDLLTGGTFVAVERLASSSRGERAGLKGSPEEARGGSGGGSTGKWVTVLDDDDWSLKFKWSRPSVLSPESRAEVVWTVPAGMPEGTYRLRHNGANRVLPLLPVGHFTGASNPFRVIADPDAAAMSVRARATAQPGAASSAAGTRHRRDGPGEMIDSDS